MKIIECSTPHLARPALIVYSQYITQNEIAAFLCSVKRCFEEPQHLKENLVELITYLPPNDSLNLWQLPPWLPFQTRLLWLFDHLFRWAAIFSSDSFKLLCYLIGCIQRAAVHLTVLSGTSEFTVNILGNCFRKQIMPSNRKHANIYSVLFKIREQTSQSIGIELVLQNLKYHLSLANLIIIFTGVHAEKKWEFASNWYGDFSYRIY